MIAIPYSYLVFYTIHGGYLMKHSLSIKSIALVESLRPISSILGLSGAYIGGIVAGAPYTSIPLLLATLVVFLMAGGSMAFNDYFDRDIDKISHPLRPIPSKRLTAKEELYFSLILFGVGLVISAFINIICFGIVLFTIAFLYAYEAYFKNYGFAGNIAVAFMSALSFTFGGAAVGKPFSSLVLSSIVFFMFSGRETLKDVQDVKGDVLSRNTLPMKIGERNAAIVGSIFLIIALLFSPFPYLLGQLKIYYLIFISIVDIICLYAIRETLKDLENTERSVSLIRTAAVIGVLAIIIGAI
jgi:geranylgeranylglycerol-phosphate geranylgeranyltransferase